MLKGKTILLGVTGGIAAYKAVETASRLTKIGAQVKVIMTKAACQLINPVTFRSIVHYPVAVDLFDEVSVWDIKHIELASSDLFLIAPATYNIIGKVANGIADDLLSTTIAATKAPVVFVPAMNTNMYENRVFTDNMKKLKDYGYKFIEPEVGRMACGTEGIGRYPETDLIIENLIRILHKKDLKNLKMLVTAGPTSEALDPVRILTNRSSGKMGYAIALAAVRRGAQVTLISGTSKLALPQDLHEFVAVESTQDMYEAVLARYKQQDIIIKAAAPMDFHPGKASAQKIKKEGRTSLTLDLKPNKDIIATIGKDKGNLILVGFAAETEHLVQAAQEKLIAKNLDFIVANDVGKAGTGFQSDDNQASLISSEGVVSLAKMSKIELADKILDEVARRWNEKKI